MYNYRVERVHLVSIYNDPAWFISARVIMAPLLPKGTRFIVPRTGKKKYTAVVPLAKGKVRRVGFGHRDYQHFKDRVPKNIGGGRWARKDHGDPARRASYRRRHGAQKCKDGTLCVKRRYSPAWFSYHFLW